MKPNEIIGNVSPLVERNGSKLAPNPTGAPRRWRISAPRCGVLLLLGLYAALRIALLPTVGPLAGGFGHDGAYNAIVATEVREGHGYINPASWLVFLNPPDLPMPFHNANPGYLTLVAVLSKLSGADVFWSGFLISALSNVLLAVAAYLLVMPFGGNRVFAVLCAAFTALFPAHLIDSLCYVPDALTTALTILCFAAVVRERFILAGCLFGLAWLCRSTAVFCLPAILVYILLCKLGKKRNQTSLSERRIHSALDVRHLNATTRDWGTSGTGRGGLVPGQFCWASDSGDEPSPPRPLSSCPDVGCFDSEERRWLWGALSRLKSALRGLYPMALLDRCRPAVSGTVGFLLAALLVASPWLVHTAQVWGSPFRSDGSYYLLQNYYADKFAQGDVTKFWRSLTPPPSLSEVLRTDAPGLLKHTVQGVPVLARNTFAQWSGSSMPIACLLAALLGLGLLWSRSLLRSPEGIAALLLCLVTFGLLCLRAQSLEMRYLGPCTVLLFLWPLAPLRQWFSRGLRRPGWAAGTTAVTAAVLLVAIWPVQDCKAVTALRGRDEQNLQRQTVAMEVNAHYAWGARVVVRGPYFYTLFTGASALSVPYATKGDLLAYMHRYRAPFLLLEKNSTDFSYPQLAPELQVRAAWEHYVLLETEEAP